MLVSGRINGLSDEEIVQRVAGVASSQDLYKRIREDGHPICTKCGTTYADDTHCRTLDETPAKKGRRARGSAPATELPPADNAASLFREKLESLLQGVEDLKHRKEKLQGGRFVQSAVYRDPDFLSRGLVSDEQWQNVQELLGLDQAAKEHMYFGGATFNLGSGSSTPQSPLPALIGAYLLAGGEVEPLVEALHPDPASAEWSKINKRIEGRKGKDNLDGLKALAEQLATAIRGGALRSGSPVAELSAHEINLASRITEGREAQVPDEKIYEDLLQGLRLSEEDLSWEEFHRLADLEQRFPWS
jgi:hypothetical protein